MASSSTIRLLDSMEWCKKFTFNRQLSLGDFKEPILSSANIVKQTILGPPFVWRWNRQVITFNTVVGQQDYSEACNFGWIENASVQDTSQSPNKWFEISSEIDLALDTSRARPTKIAGQLDDGAGNITFRLMPVPDRVYPVSITVQKKASLFTGLNDKWDPIPDEYSYIYQWGLLAHMYMFSDDPRFGTANSKFVSGLLGAAQGLTDTQRNIFLNNWFPASGQTLFNQMSLSQGVQARQT
jgi:hypothetical protein